MVKVERKGQECPKCGKEIGRLLVMIIKDQNMFFIDEFGEPDYKFIGIKDTEFLCPICCGVIFSDIKEATKFLRGDLRDGEGDVQGCL